MKRLFLLHVVGRIFGNGFSFIWKIVKPVLTFFANLIQVGLCAIVAIVFLVFSLIFPPKKIGNHFNTRAKKDVI
jgi:hypothetical protein